MKNKKLTKKNRHVCQFYHHYKILFWSRQGKGAHFRKIGKKICLKIKFFLIVPGGNIRILKTKVSAKRTHVVKAFFEHPEERERFGIF